LLDEHIALFSHLSYSHQPCKERYEAFSFDFKFKFQLIKKVENCLSF